MNSFVLCDNFTNCYTHILQLVENLKNTSTGCLSKLIASGGDTNLTDRFGRAPLHLAAINGNTEVAIVLLKGGAMINARDKVMQCKCKCLSNMCTPSEQLYTICPACRMALLLCMWQRSTVIMG